MAEPGPDPLTRWSELAAGLRWARAPRRALETASGGAQRWFPGGRLNLATNAVHRHLDTRGDQVALHWEGEPGDRRDLTYADLHRDVTAAADALATLGVDPGDRVGLHVALIPEAVTLMLACARIGAVFSVLPAVLPADALADRLADLAPRVLVTQDGAWRHGVVLPLKQRADEALTAVGSVEHTIVIRRTGIGVPWFEGDRWYEDLVAAPRPGSPRRHVDAVDVDSDHPALVSYLASRGGRPTGAVHGTAGLAVYCAALHHAFVRPGEVLWVPAELGWLLCQTNGILGPLLAGGSAVIFEGMLDTPSPARAWDVIARYGVSGLVATPSVLRAVRSWSEDAPTAVEVKTLRRIVTAGEALDVETERWLRGVVAHDRLDVVNAWGQVELGGAVAFLTEPSDAVVPDAGLRVEDEAGNPTAPEVEGDLVLRRPWPGTALGVLRDGTAEPFAPRARGDRTFPTRRHGAYVTGDRARVDADGRLELLGRVDRAFSVAGQLVSATDVRSALEEHPFVTRSEVVDRPDVHTGRAVVAVIEIRTTEDGPDTDHELAEDLRSHVRDRLGGLSQPRVVIFIDQLPERTDAATLTALRNLAMPGTGVQRLTRKELDAATVAATVAAPDQLGGS